MITTKQQAVNLSESLQKIQDKIYKNKRVTALFESELDEDSYNFFKEINNIKNIEDLTKKDITQAIQKTLEQIKNTPVITLEVSFEPSVEFTNVLFEKIKVDYKINHFLDFIVNKDEFSGAKIEYKGKIFEDQLVKF